MAKTHLDTTQHAVKRLHATCRRFWRALEYYYKVETRLVKVVEWLNRRLGYGKEAPSE